MSLAKACGKNAIPANRKNRLEEKGDLIYCLLFLLKRCTVVIIFLFYLIYIGHFGIIFSYI